MAATLALTAALLFAVAATLQQKGALNLGGVSLASPASLLRLVGQTMWLLGTVALLAGYVFQAAALDRGRLSIIQPLLVTTVVFALPLGYFLTAQHVGRREVVGAAVILFGLALFTYFADPSGGNENAPGRDWAIAIAVLGAICVVLLAYGGRGGASATTKAAVFGTIAGILFGLSASLTKPTLEYLHDGLEELLTHWEAYALAIAGVLGFVLAAGLVGNGEARSLSRHRLGGEPRRRHRDRDASARGTLEQASVAHHARDRRPRRGPCRCRSHLPRNRNAQGSRLEDRANLAPIPGGPLGPDPERVRPGRNAAKPRGNAGFGQLPSNQPSPDRRAWT